MNIGLLGIGTIGSGVFEQINKNFGKFSETSKIPAKITKVLDKDPNKKVEGAVLTDSPDEILKDDSINIIVALMGGSDFEYEQIKEALKNKKHVVTANKAVIGAHLEELTNLAKDNKVMLRYEASVGGGIPIIESLEKQIRNNEIKEIKGILNGTSNFILTKMIKDKVDFSNALKEAQATGFAEANPDSDLDGDDAARKLAILSSLAYGTIINDDLIPKRGIRDITSIDIAAANRMGYTIKHVAQSVNKDNSISLIVEPVFVKKNDIFGSVDNEFNIITLEGDRTGPLMFYGKGAGKEATANAVVNDVLDIIQAIDENSIIEQPEFLDNISIDNKGIKGKFYLRINSENSRLINLTDIMERLSELGEIEHISTSEGKIMAITEPVDSNEFRDFIEKLELPSDEFFFARILE